MLFLKRPTMSYTALILKTPPCGVLYGYRPYNSLYIASIIRPTIFMGNDQSRSYPPSPSAIIPAMRKGLLLYNPAAGRFPVRRYVRDPGKHEFPCCIIWI
jgi:hypothetical protein